MSLRTNDRISPWMVMKSNGGYYVGREEDGYPYDRRSGYFKTFDEANQELCGMVNSGHDVGENGRCKGCDKLVYMGLFITFLKASPTQRERKKILKMLTKSELDGLSKTLQVNPLIKTKSSRIEILSQME
jgi:hypothetical protein